MRIQPQQTDIQSYEGLIKSIWEAASKTASHISKESTSLPCVKTSKPSVTNAAHRGSTTMLFLWTTKLHKSNVKSVHYFTTEKSEWRQSIFTSHYLKFLSGFNSSFADLQDLKKTTRGDVSVFSVSYICSVEVILKN